MIETNLVTKFNYSELIRDIANGGLVLLPLYNSAESFLIGLNHIYY
jgi:hypothetical protein